jgi:hypothetical protein
MRVGGGRLHRDLGRFFVIAVALAGWAASTVPAQQYPESLFQEMRWREIGPLRGGKTRAVCGVPSRPATQADSEDCIQAAITPYRPLPLMGSRSDG